MWTRYLEHREEGQPIGAVGLAKDSGFYYSDNAIVRLKRFGEAREFLSGPGAKYLIGTSDPLEELVRKFPGHWETIDRSHSTHQLVRYEPSDDPI